MFLKKTVAIVAPALALTFGAAEGARAELITNGNFESTNKTNYRMFFSQTSGATVAGWTSSGYNFIYAPQASTTSGTAADNAGAVGEYKRYGQYDNVKLWGPGTNSTNGLTLSPVGGNFIASDPDYEGPASISQTINGLTVGDQYQLTFYWAGAQQSGYSGKTEQWWEVKLGSDSQTTNHVTVSSKGFVDWMKQSLTFTATASSETLSFISHSKNLSGPGNLPPFLLLDGVSMTSAVPEPSSVLLMGAGVVGLGVVGVRRRRTADSASA